MSTPLGINVACIDMASIDVAAVDAALVDVAAVDVADVDAACINVADMDVVPLTWDMLMRLLGVGMALVIMAPPLH